MMTFHRVCQLFLALSALSVLTAVSPHVDAQDDKRASREREALRRTQQALKTSEEQRESLLREKEAWSRDKAALDASLKQAQALAASGDAQARAERSRNVQLRSSVAASADAVAQWKQALEASEARTADLADKLAKTQAALDERTRTLASVNMLLERSTQKNTLAEEKNRKLYALGRDLIAQVRERTGTEPVVGLGRVELENWAEGARDDIDANRLRSAP